MELAVPLTGKRLPSVQSLDLINRNIGIQQSNPRVLTITNPLLSLSCKRWTIDDNEIPAEFLLIQDFILIEDKKAEDFILIADEEEEEYFILIQDTVMETTTESTFGLLEPTTGPAYLFLESNTDPTNSISEIPVELEPSHASTDDLTTFVNRKEEKDNFENDTE